MLLTKVNYNRNVESYIIDLLVPLIDSPFITFKFDTGASSTIITAGSLCESGEERVRLAYFLESCRRTGRYISKPLYSAYGDGKHGILCHIKDFVFPGGVPFTFYFYLIYLTGHVKALLGADFISCCDCNLKAKEDIEITKFHDSIYKGTFGFASQSGSLDFVKVMTTLPKIQLPEEFETFKMSDGQMDLQKVYDFLDSMDDIDLQKVCDSLDFMDDAVGAEEVLKPRSFKRSKGLKEVNCFDNL